MTRIMPILLLMLVAAGCSSTRGGRAYDLYEAAPAEPGDAVAARVDHERALAELDAGDEAAAEAALRRALAADVMFGPAHNTLGTLFYRQGRLYEAAWEFQYAAKLMPGRAEPLNNLGLVFERVGKLGDAEASYGRALDLEPDNVEVLGNFARARHRQGDESPEMAELLRRLIRLDLRPQWLDWAGRTLEQIGPG